MDNGFLKKGCLFQTAFTIVVVYLVLWLIYGIKTVSTSPFALASALVPLGGLILSLYKQHIGGLLIIFSGFLPIIILANTPGEQYATFGIIILAIFATFPLCVAGGIMIAVAPSEKPLESLKRGRKYMKLGGIKGKVGWFCDKCNAEVAETDKICPNCGVEFKAEMK